MNVCVTDVLAADVALCYLTSDKVHHSPLERSRIRRPGHSLDAGWIVQTKIVFS